jgi:hypothetical protein
MKRPGTVPLHHRDQTDGAGSFWPTLWLTCTIAGGGIVVAVIFQLCTATVWGFAS